MSSGTQIEAATARQVVVDKLNMDRHMTIDKQGARVNQT
jgi:hypothetical protein